MAKKIGKKQAASKPAAVAKRPAPAKAASKMLKPSSKAAAKPVAKAAKPSNIPAAKPATKASGKPGEKSVAKPAAVAVIPTAKTVVAKVAATAVAAVKPIAAVAKSAVAAVSRPARPAKPPKIVYPVAEKSAVVTAYAKNPGVKFVPPVSVPVKKQARLIESKPVRLPPPPVRSDSKMAKNRAGLTSREVEHFRDLLLEKRRELLGDVSSMETSALRSGNSNLSTLPMHMADSGTDNYEQEFTLGLVEKDRQLMREINVALAKVQDGSYGICEGTGKPIAKPRLEAQPWAKYSIEHARALEKPQFRRAF